MSESQSQPELKPEIEATFINIDKDQLRAQLKGLCAKLLQPELLMRRTIFDIDDYSFVRVRDEGNRITMSYKHLDAVSLSGMKEICLNVNNYDEAIAFVKACGLKIKAVQETLREEWELDGVELDIDTWPWLPPLMLKSKARTKPRSNPSLPNSISIWPTPSTAQLTKFTRFITTSLETT